LDTPTERQQSKGAVIAPRRVAGSSLASSGRRWAAGKSDPWPHSEAGRFHRVISLLLIALAAVIVVGERLELLDRLHPV
jgi:hypothetical protein